MKNYNRFAEFNRNRCKVPDAIDAIYQRFQGPKTNLNKPKCIKYRECPPLCNPEDDDDDDGDKSDFSCECIISVDAIQKRLQTILKNSKYIHDCRGDEKILECIDLCNDREERLRKLYEKYNEKYQHDIETQKAKLLALSQPKQKLSPWDVQKHPFTVRKSALTYKCTPRMLKIAQVNPKNITQKYRPPSVPKYSMKELKERQKKWKALLKEQRGKKKTHSRKKLKKKKKSTVASEKKKKVLDEMYARLAEPKKLFKDPTPEKKPPKPYAEIMQRTRELLALAKPPEPRIDIDEFFKPKLVPEGYQPSPRLLELAKPRELPEEYVLNQNYEWKIKQSALDYVPTERILKLAVPKIRKDPEPDFDPDAFKVKKSALRYKPSKRILELAKPRVYPE